MTRTWSWIFHELPRTMKKDRVRKDFAFQMKPRSYACFEMYLWSNGTAYCDRRRIDGRSGGSKESSGSI
ncbi:MAG: hypothetical protein ACLR2O_12080 [Coprococcus sp.]